MTDELLNLRAPVKKAPGADMSREMIVFAAGRLMEMEAGALTGAPYDKTQTMQATTRSWVSSSPASSSAATPPSRMT
jgi:hypothetical protein